MRNFDIAIPQRIWVDTELVHDNKTGRRGCPSLGLEAQVVKRILGDPGCLVISIWQVTIEPIAEAKAVKCAGGKETVICVVWRTEPTIGGTSPSFSSRNVRVEQPIRRRKANKAASHIIPTEEVAVSIPERWVVSRGKPATIVGRVNSKPTPIWRRLLKHLAFAAWCLALSSAGKSMAAKMAMMAITTRSSINVNAGLELRCGFITRPLLSLYQVLQNSLPLGGPLLQPLQIQEILCVYRGLDRSLGHALFAGVPAVMRGVSIRE